MPDLKRILPEYLDIGVEDEEMGAIILITLQQRVRKLKLSIADAIVQAEASLLMDNLEGQHVALKQARKLKKEYYHFYAELRRLEGSEGEDSDED